MAFVLYFLVLLYQTDSTAAQCNVTNCDPDTCAGTNCTKCVAGYYISGPHCSQCPHACSKCNSANSCIACLPGRHGHNCQDSCPSDCITCTSMSDCTECRNGTYGATCGDNCMSQCVDGTCDKELGNCSNECPPKQYLDPAQVCTNCSNRCDSCIDSINCTTCDKEYNWGQTCQYDCSGCYGHCNKSNGCSVHCDDNYYQLYNAHKKGYECIRCPDLCVTCRNATECITCAPDHWGSYCQYNCTDCSTVCNKDDGCSGASGGCFYGYFQSKIQQGFLCLKCSDNCAICSNATTCIECETGYFPDDGTNCVTCSDKCKTEACFPSDGVCTDGCIDGRSGQRCNAVCPLNCQHCEQLNASACNSCKIGYYGDSCENNCSNHCKQENGHQPCHKNGGDCIYGCGDSYWGSTCSEPCESGCKGLVCNETTGECLNGCNVTYYGIHCENKCSSNCVMASESQRQCNELNGSCQKGCKDGWFWNNCTKQCNPACTAKTCFQDNGTCVIGYGDYSSTVSTSAASTERTVTSLPSEGDSNIDVPVGAGAGTAVIVIVVVVVVVLILRRRRATDKMRFQDESISLETINGTLGTEENAYATISDSKSKESSDISPGTVILNEESSLCISKEPATVIANTGIVDESDQSDTLKMLPNKDTLANSSHDFKSEPHFPMYKEEQNSLKAEPSTVYLEKNNTDDDLVLGEESEEQQTKEGVDEEEKSYYNIVGKRVPVSGLAEYVKDKDSIEIIEEFHKLPQGLQKDCNIAKIPRNATKNRYRLIYPYDESRVILKDGDDDYMNASFIGGYNGPNEYIGSSGPFKREKGNIETVSDFWRMVWQEKCETIVMLTKCCENAVYKCEQYWSELGNINEYAKLHVTCVTEDKYADFTIRSFVVTKDGKTLNTRHLHFTAWPDKGVPADVTSMIEYRQKVRSLHKEKTCPMIVHCSAGIGRTGTFIALDLLTFMGEAQGYVDIFGCVANLRSQRVNLVQTSEQYEYLHRAILHALTFDCQSITAEKFIETYSKLIKKKNGTSHIETQFQKLQSTLDEMSANDQTAMDRNGALTNKNRGGADIPGDENRVRLYENRKPGASDYINAVYINGFRSRNKFIVAQTPLPTTLVDFLCLIFQVKCACVVVMEETDLQDQVRRV